jgi:hypothetical protein
VLKKQATDLSKKIDDIAKKYRLKEKRLKQDIEDQA